LSKKNAKRTFPRAINQKRVQQGKLGEKDGPPTRTVEKKLSRGGSTAKGIDFG